MSTLESEDFEEFLAQNTTGWVVVYIGRELTPKKPLFVNVVGPFDSQVEATRHAQKLRRRHAADVSARRNYSELEKLSVRPLWKPQP